MGFSPWHHKESDMTEHTYANTVLLIDIYFNSRNKFVWCHVYFCFHSSGRWEASSTFHPRMFYGHKQCSGKHAALGVINALQILLNNRASEREQ